ncbi:hypothetical protein ACNSN2_11075 [Pseudoalteromonas sp. US3C1013]|uniref:hypothetical protein n=1 Tax=unclassified Pseudoalteromonas TaxID=194690 RepID=UPI003AB49BF5
MNSKTFFCKDAFLKDVCDGKASFDDNVLIWNSKFPDGVWDFRDTKKADGMGKRTNSIVWLDYYPQATNFEKHHNFERMIKYERKLSESIILDIKAAAAIYLHFPKLLKHSKNTKSIIDPKTVKGRIDELLKFFSYLYMKLKKEGLNIDNLQDISYAQLKVGIKNYNGRSSHLKRALKLISDPIIQMNLQGKLSWSLIDIESRSINWKDVAEYKGILTLPDNMFLFLMNHARSSIGNFLFAIGHKQNDELAGEATRIEFLKSYPGLAKTIHTKLNPDLKTQSKKYKECNEDYGYGIRDVGKIINDVQCSAIVTVFLLSGMRMSEVQYVLRDCLTIENGYQFIRSKVVKQKCKDLPINDTWIATPLALDAINVLRLLTSHTGNPYLISGLEPREKDKGYKLPYTSGGLRAILKRWIVKIDHDKIFNNWNFSVHQLRETLVFQLARAEVGLPFISMQLKHFQHRFKSIPSEVSVGYGEYKKNLLSDIATKTPAARESILQEIYGENCKFAGGAAETHKARIDTFFSGLGLFGKDREHYIKSLAQKGVEIMPTSIGGCTKNFIVAPKESVKPPPCYGDFQCDPDCENHLISESCKPALQSRYEMAVKKAGSELNEGNAIVWRGLSENLKKHLSKLQIDIKEIN